MSHYGGLLTGLQDTKNNSITNPKSEAFMTGNRLPDVLDFVEGALKSSTTPERTAYTYVTDTDAFMTLIKLHYNYIFRSCNINIHLIADEDRYVLQTLNTILNGSQDNYLKDYVRSFLDFIGNFTNSDDLKMTSFDTSVLTKAKGRFLKSDDKWLWDYYDFMIQAICYTFSSTFTVNYSTSENITFMIPTTYGVLEAPQGANLFIKSFKSSALSDYLQSYTSNGSQLTPYEKFIMTVVLSNFNPKEENDYINSLLVLFNILAYSARPVDYSLYKYTKGGMCISIRNIIASLYKKRIVYSERYMNEVISRGFKDYDANAILNKLCLGLPFTIYDHSFVSCFIYFIKEQFRDNFKGRNFEPSAYIPNNSSAFHYFITARFCCDSLWHIVYRGSSKKTIERLVNNYNDLAPKAAIEAVVGAVSEQDMDFDPEAKLKEEDAAQDEGTQDQPDPATAETGDTTGDDFGNMGDEAGDDSNNIAQPTGADLTPGTPPPDGATLAIPLRTQEDKPAAATLYRHAVLRMCARLSAKPGMIEQSKLEKLTAWVDYWLFFSPVFETVKLVKQLGLDGNLSTLVPVNTGTTRE